ncbi:MAG TPA: phage tail sheath subtilisin-like domain-containing protein [Candidatus Binataceae bacterium]|nr:phage tail sheath subtilisin-like domain-containing protein [Candidatus Binataceae bacterium]
MPASFLHGVEVFEFNLGPVPVNVVNSAVIGLVGSAPLFAVPGAIPLWDPSWMVQAQPQWTLSIAESIGNLIVDSNGNTQKCTTAGITGTSTPTWARTLNATTSDGTVVWTLIALGASAGQQCVDSNGSIQTAIAITLPGWQSAHAYSLGSLVLDSNGNTQRITAVSGTGTSGASAPAWATTPGSTTIDNPGTNQISWTLIAIGAAAITNTSAPSWATVVGNTTSDSIGATTGSVTWTLSAKGPIPNLQQPVLISGSNPNSLAPGQAGVFGPLIQGFTIPYALNQVFAQGAGQIVTVNVFDQTRHYTTIPAANYAFPPSGVQVINVGHMGLSQIKITNIAGTVTYVEGADFNVDRVNGVVTAIGGGLLTAGQGVKIICNYADPSKLVDSDLVGTVSSNVYTGMQCWKISYGLMGFFPKLLMAPSFGTNVAIGQTVGSQDVTVTAGMATVAAAIRAMYFVDCQPGSSPATLLADRSASGSSFNTSDKRAILCGPQQLFLDTGINPTGIAINPVSGAAIQNPANTTHAGPYSPWVAGATSAKDLAQGYWWSPSNTQIVGALGPDVSIYSSFLDSASDTNTLNSQGIVTAFQAFGTGIRVWGNRSSGYPSYNTPDVFISIRRTMDVIEQSVMLSMMQFLDQPISNGLISSILASVNSFMRTLIGRGALVAGSARYNPAENPSSQVAAGQLVFDIDCMPPPPSERMTFNVFIDTNLLSQLSGNTSGGGAESGRSSNCVRPLADRERACPERQPKGRYEAKGEGRPRLRSGATRNSTWRVVGIILPHRLNNRALCALNKDPHLPLHGLLSH